MNEKEPAANGRLLIELLGPAGAGKTTLADSLCKSRDNVIVAPLLKFRDPRNIVLLLRGIVPLLPLMMSHPRSIRRFTLRHVKMMVELNCWHHAIRHRTALRTRVILLVDHGPLYMLATLREFGPPVASTGVFLRWWDKALENSINHLDAVVALDAPNEVLARRINTRPTVHVVKGVPEAEAYEFLARYRRAFAEILIRAHIGNGVPVLIRAKTSEMSTSEIKGNVWRTMDTVH